MLTEQPPALELCAQELDHGCSLAGLVIEKVLKAGDRIHTFQCAHVSALRLNPPRRVQQSLRRSQAILTLPD